MELPWLKHYTPALFLQALPPSFPSRADVGQNQYTMLSRRKRGTVPICRNGPKGAAHKWGLSPFSSGRPANPTGQIAVAAIVLCVLAGGCVERRVLVRTNPPGAALYVDDHEVGLTPVPFSPIYYGTRTIRLVKDGYETLTVKQYLPPPWYEVPPLDFVSENVVPGKLNDSRTLDFQLRPQTVVPKKELLARAENLRRGTRT